MFAYYLQLALLSLKRHKGLTVLMVLATAMGIAACMTTFTVYRLMAADPMPGKSDRLFRVQVDARTFPAQGVEEPPEELTRRDAKLLLQSAKALRQSVSGGLALYVIRPEAPERPLPHAGRFVTADFLPMFDVKIRHGQAWTAAQEASREPVILLSETLARTLFGQPADAVGQMVQAGRMSMRVLGVYEDWKKVPAFYDLSIGSVHEPVAFLVPADLALDKKMGFMGSLSCWDRTNDPLAEDAQCAYLQFWVEFAKPQDAQSYRQFLADFSAEQKRTGRYLRDPNVRLRELRDWLSYKQVVPQDVTLQSWMGLGFLLVCLVNTVGLMLAKCLRRSSEIGIRRALGASRRQVFLQFLVEAGLLGSLGGLLGMGLTALGLWGISQGGFQHAGAVHIDGVMLASTLAVAVAAALLAGILPAWRACSVVPALQLKSQ